jgi:ABC-type Fe3+ transport system substrate-binding protein
MILLIFALTILLVSFSQPFLEVRAEARVLKIVSPHAESIRNEFTTAFNAWYLQKYNEVVDVKWSDLGGTAGAMKYIESQFLTNASSIGLDVMYGGGVDPFIKLASEGYLAPYKLPDPILSQIPKDFTGIPMYDSNYLWYGAALSGFGIMYNKPVLQKLGLPEPKTWIDLTAPAAEGWVSAAEPRQSGSTHMAYEIILQGYGWEKGWQVITQMGANTKSFPTASTTVPSTVSKGDAAYGLVIDFYAWDEIARNGADKIGYVMPEGLTVVNPDAIAILKGAPNMDLAQRFEEFVLSDVGQSLWMLKAGAPGGPKKDTLGRMSVIPSLYSKLGPASVVPVNPFNLKSTLHYNATTGSAHYAVLNDMIGPMIIDQHDTLVAAWDKINDAAKTRGINNYSMDAARALLGATPITQQQADAYGAKWQDQVFRNQQISVWRQFALEKYANATALAIKAATEAQPTAAVGTAQQQQLTYIVSGVAAIIMVASGFYVTMKRRKEAAEIKK